MQIAYNANIRSGSYWTILARHSAQHYFRNRDTLYCTSEIPNVQDKVSITHYTLDIATFVNHCVRLLFVYCILSSNK